MMPDLRAAGEDDSERGASQGESVLEPESGGWFTREVGLNAYIQGDAVRNLARLDGLAELEVRSALEVSQDARAAALMIADSSRAHRRKLARLFEKTPRSVLVGSESEANRMGELVDAVGAGFDVHLTVARDPDTEERRLSVTGSGKARIERFVTSTWLEVVGAQRGSATADSDAQGHVGVKVVGPMSLSWHTPRELDAVILDASRGIFVEAKARRNHDTLDPAVIRQLREKFYQYAVWCTQVELDLQVLLVVLTPVFDSERRDALQKRLRRDLVDIWPDVRVLVVGLHHYATECRKHLAGEEVGP